MIDTVICRGCYSPAPASSAACPRCGVQLATAPQPAYAAEAAPMVSQRQDVPILNGQPVRRSGHGTGGLGRLLGPLGAVGLMLAKFKGALLLLFKFKFFLMFASMAVSVWAYAAAWGLGVPAAIGLVALIFVHELGHAVAFKLKGGSAGAPVFVPFFGAYVRGQVPSGTAADMGEVALAGPLAGTAASLVCLGLGQTLGGHLWPYLALLGLFLNLLNLLPIGFLDGGRVAHGLSGLLWLPGLALVGYLFFRQPNPLLAGIGLLGAYQLLRVVTGAARRADGGPEGQRVMLGLLYFALIALIALMLAQDPAFGWGSL